MVSSLGENVSELGTVVSALGERVSIGIKLYPNRDRVDIDPVCHGISIAINMSGHIVGALFGKWTLILFVGPNGTHAKVSL